MKKWFDTKKKGSLFHPNLLDDDQGIFCYNSKPVDDTIIPFQTPVQGVSSIHTSITMLRVVLISIGIGMIFATIFGRLLYLQVFAYDTYLARSERNRERVIPIVSERGIIYDVHGVQLTKNIPKFALAIVPQDLPRYEAEREVLVTRLAHIINDDIDIVRNKILEFGSYSYESIIIKDNLDYETALTLQIAASDLPGIFIQRGSKRLYQAGEIAATGESIPIGTLSHILGYQGKLNREELDRLYRRGYYPSDVIGKTGIEQTYETELRGTYGARTIEVNARGREQATLSEEPPYPGNQLYLSIDSVLQRSIEVVLEKYLRQIGKQNASVVAMDPRTGAIRALVSWPAFDNNDFSGGISVENYAKYINDDARPLFNRAISGAFPSGSTVKPAVAAAALQERIITEQTAFRSDGGIRVGQWFFPDWQAGGHGITNVTRSIAWSVNTFYYIIGGGYEEFTGLGIDTMVSYLRQFGLASVLGIDIPGEVSGFLPSREWKERVKNERWYVGDTYNVSIGQGDLLVTPLQMAALTSAIANGGTLYQPYVVAEIKDPVTGDTLKTEPRIIREGFISPQHMRVVGKGMRECVTYGSCRRLSLLPFETAGKTGTAQWSSVRDNHAWFTSYAPYTSPEIVFALLVEEGEGGSTIGSPIMFDIFNWWWKYRNGETNEPLAYTTEI